MEIESWRIKTLFRKRREEKKKACIVDLGGRLAGDFGMQAAESPGVKA